MCRRINSLSRKVRISVLRFRKRWQRSLANFLLIGIRNQFPRFEIFIFTRVPMLTFLFRLNSLLDGRSLAVRLLHLGLAYFAQKISYLLDNLDRPTLSPRVSQGLRPGPQRRSQFLSSSRPLERGCLVLRVFSTFQNGGRFQQSQKRTEC